MRTVKSADERKDEILDAAQRLFAEKGFDGTSTGDILDAVGIARGTLYYHFRSKEEILDAVIERMTRRMLGRARECAEDRTQPLARRLTACIAALNMRSDDAGREVIEQMHRPQNALMHQKSRDMLLKGMVPLLTSLIEEGSDSGLFSTEYPRQAVGMIMLYANTAFDGESIERLSPEQAAQEINGFIYNIERLLGAQKDSLRELLLPLFAQE